jgi:hypothetical protein
VMARDVAREAWERRALCRILSTCARCGELQTLEVTDFGAWGLCGSPECEHPERLLWWRY